MACSGHAKESSDSSFAPSFDNELSKMAVLPYTATELEEFGVIGIAAYSGDLTAELSVTSKTAGVFWLCRNA